MSRPLTASRKRSASPGPDRYEHLPQVEFGNRLSARPFPGEHRVRLVRSRGYRARTVVVGPPTSVLVGGDVTPNPQYGSGGARGETPSVSFGSIFSGGHHTAVCPVVAQIEGVLELGTGFHGLVDLGRVDVQCLAQRAWSSRDQVVADLRGGGDHSTVVEGEHRQMGEVPPGEGAVDGVREVGEGVRRSDREDPSRTGPQLLPTPTE